jgi:hypothetical protein
MITSAAVGALKIIVMKKVAEGFKSDFPQTQLY